MISQLENLHYTKTMFYIPKVLTSPACYPEVVTTKMKWCLEERKYITLGILGQISEVQKKQYHPTGLTAASNTTFQGTWTNFP